VFEAFDRGRYLDGAFVRRLPAALRADIQRHGIRNSHLTAIAPTGTISLLANNVSSGIEPVFEPRYQRTLRTRTADTAAFEVEDHACRLWRLANAESVDDPPALRTARAIAPHDHLLMQAALQPLVDQAIAKTINVPEDLSLEAFADIYREAHQLGLKGVTTFRPSPDRPGVMTGCPAR